MSTTPRKKILLSDDSSLLLGVRESLLQTSQVSPLIASTGSEIMALVRSWKPDLMILGPREVAAVTQTLKNSKEYREIPVIAVLDPSNASEREKTLEAGCDDWLTSPVDEMDLLAKIQDFLGLRFRKLPRYTHNAPALVSFKGKDFPCRSVDINRRMIFVETSEGLAPATDRNVRLSFQLTKEEPISCWGRVVKLMARKGPQEEKEIIGMLIRFLDLPASAQRRIDTLALRQYDNARLPEEAPAGKAFAFYDTEFYRDQLNALLGGESRDLEEKLSIPPAVLTTYLSSLSSEERSAIRAQDKNSALLQSIAVRVHLMDEITKFREGAPLERVGNTLAVAQRSVAQLQDKLDDAIQRNDEASMQLWAAIKTETLRNAVDLESMTRRNSPFVRTLENAQQNVEQAQARINKLPLLLVVLVAIFSILLNVRLLNEKTEAYRPIDIGVLGAEGNYLTRAHVLKPSLNQWSVFIGTIGSAWAQLSAEQRSAALHALQAKLQAKGVRQIILLEPDGRVNTSVMNDESHFYRP